MDSIEYLDPENINGLNLFAYCGNNPVVRVDYNGNAWCHWLLGAVAVVALCAVAVGITALTGGTGTLAFAVALGAILSLLVEAYLETVIFFLSIIALELIVISFFVIKIKSRVTKLFMKYEGEAR